VFDIELLSPLSSCTVGIMAGYLLRQSSRSKPAAEVTVAPASGPSRAAEVGDAILQLSQQMAQRVDEHNQVIQQTCDELRSTPEQLAAPSSPEVFDRMMEALDRLVTANEHLQRDLDDSQLRLQFQTEQLQSPEERAHTDPLTLTRNRGFLDAELHRRLTSGPSDEPLALVLLEIDSFSRLNDACGQLAGDGVLQQFAQRLLLAVRDRGLVARFAGPVFAVVLPGCDESASRAMADQLRQQVSSRPMFVGGRQLDITVTAVATSRRHEESIAAWQGRTAEALHRAKQVGPADVLADEPPLDGRSSAVRAAPATDPSTVVAHQGSGTRRAGPVDPEEFLRSHGPLIADLQQSRIAVQLLVISSQGPVDDFWGRAICLHIRVATRGFDRIGPLGHDQWCVCFPNCDPETARTRSERIRAGLSRHGREQGHVGTCPPLGFGLATLSRSETARAFLDRATRAAESSIRNGGRPMLAGADSVPTASTIRG
jgi:diguanylate cyclase (GGDEF)-like protein